MVIRIVGSKWVLWVTLNLLEGHWHEKRCTKYVAKKLNSLRDKLFMQIWGSQLQVNTHIITQTQRNTNSHTPIHSYTHIHTHTHTHTYIYIQTLFKCITK